MPQTPPASVPTPTRYDCDIDDGMRKDVSGEFVTHLDYESLQRENAALSAQAAEFDAFREWCYVTIGTDQIDLLKVYLERGPKEHAQAALAGKLAMALKSLYEDHYLSGIKAHYLDQKSAEAVLTEARQLGILPESAPYPTR